MYLTKTEKINMINSVLGIKEYIPTVHSRDDDCYACATQRHNCSKLDKLDLEQKND